MAISFPLCRESSEIDHQVHQNLPLNITMFLSFMPLFAAAEHLSRQRLELPRSYRVNPPPKGRITSYELRFHLSFSQFVKPHDKPTAET